MGEMLFLEGVQQGQHKRDDEQCRRSNSVNVQALENYDGVSLAPSGTHNATSICLCHFGFKWEGNKLVNDSPVWLDIYKTIIQSDKLRAIDYSAEGQGHVIQCCDSPTHIDVSWSSGLKSLCVYFLSDLKLLLMRQEEDCLRMN